MNHTVQSALRLTEEHESMPVFLGEWKASGTSYGNDPHSRNKPGSTRECWLSDPSARWHSGRFFLIHEEHALVGGKPFDTPAVFGVEASTGNLFAQTFENHRFERRYELECDGRTWWFDGETERARIDFGEDGNTQIVVGDWQPANDWLPLCDRVAIKQGSS